MKRWQIVLGIILITLGLIALVENVLDIDLGRYIGPLILVGLGLLLILRPRTAGKDVNVEMRILGDLRKTGDWEATDHEVWWFVGSNRLDFTNARFPKGEAKIKIIGFVADVVVIVPEDVGLEIESTAFVNEIKGINGSEQRIFNPLYYQSPNYGAVDKHVVLETLGFVSEIKVKQSLL